MPAEHMKGAVLSSTDALSGRTRTLTKLMSLAMLGMIATTMLAGFHLLPGWTPLIPSTVITMSIGFMLLATISDAAERWSFVRLYEWAMIIAAPTVAILAWAA